MKKRSRQILSTLLMTAVLASIPAMAKKTRIAVSPFSDRSGDQSSTTASAEVGKAASHIGTKGDLGGQVADAIITELVKLGRYDIVERVQLEKVISEQQLQLADLDDVSKASEAARILGADFVITGSITEAASAQTGKGYVVLKKQELLGRVVVDSRLIDIRTTKALWGATNEGVETLTSKKIVGIGKDNLAGVQLLLGKAARKAANDFVKELIPVLDQYTGGGTGLALEAGATLRGEHVYIAVGTKVGVSDGDEFDLFVLGEPFTVGNKTIREPIQVGSMVVEDAQPEYSRGPAPSALLGVAKISLEGLTARRRDPAGSQQEATSPEESSAALEQAVEHRVVSVDVARLRSGPGTDYDRTGELQRGSRIEILAVQGNWLQIRTDDGVEAWIHASLTSDA